LPYRRSGSGALRRGCHAHVMRITVLLALSALLVSGCGDSDGAQTNEDAVSVITDALLEEGEDDPNALQLTDAEAECVAGEVIDRIDRERLEELGLDAEAGAGPDLYEPPLEPAEGDEVFEAIETCIDLTAKLKAAFAADGSLTDEQAACIAGAYVGSGVLRDALLSAETDDALEDRIDGVLADADATCVG
jgi:hypothetical protein